MEKAYENDRVGGIKAVYGIPCLIGLAVALSVVVFYLGLHTLTSDWNNAMVQLEEYEWWIVALSFGLGVQAALYSFMRNMKERLQGTIKGAISSLAASGGMSTASMAACCTHYLAAFLPALGLSFLSTAATGMAKYQSEFFLLGLISNLYGIGVMLRLMAGLKQCETKPL